MCLHTCHGLWRGLGVGGGKIRLHRATVTFRGPAAKQAIAVCPIGVNKVPQNFETLFATCLEAFGFLKIHCVTSLTF
jgi:hypothetical protein